MHPKKDIQRALAGELNERQEARLRAHLRGCARCRAEYDEQVLLLRALAGEPETPTAQEQERIARLAVAAAFPGEQAAEACSERGPRTGWGWRPALVATGLAVVLAAVGLAVWPADTPLAGGDPVAVVKSSSAVVILPEPEGGAEGAVLYGVPVVSVAPRGWVEMELRRGGSLRLSEGAQATLAASGNQITLVSGRVDCQIDPGQGSFQVDTPSARVQVVGTQFDVEVRSSGATRVRVGQGEVEVADRQGRRAVRLKAGYTTLVAPGTPPAKPAPITKPEPVSEWDLIRQGLRQAGRDFVELFR